MKPGWIRTYTGRYLNILDPQPDMISLEDIAHHLSLECRWAGATTRHYSVAEHSIHVASIVKRLVPFGCQDRASLYGLIHDAHEAYMKDIPTPLKVLLGDAYTTLCNGIDVAIRAKFKLEAPEEGIVAAVHMADSYAAWFEGRGLITQCFAMNKVSGKEPPLSIRETEGLKHLEGVVMVEHDFMHRFNTLLRQVNNASL